MFIALGAALFGLLCAVSISATSLDGVAAELLAPRRWVLLAAGVGINLGVLTLMRRYLTVKASIVFAVFVALVVASLVAGFRWGQMQVPVGFWLGDILVMGIAHLAVSVRASRRKALQPDVQSSFLASRLWK